MKKIVGFILSLALMLSVVACLNVAVAAEDAADNGPTTEQVTELTTEPTTEEEKPSCTEHKPVKDEGYEATCDKDGLTDGSHCEICGQVITEQQVIPKAHKFSEWEVKTEASAEKAGEKTRKCTVCEYVETEEIPKLILETPNNIVLKNEKMGISVSWNAVPSATSYKIYKRSAGQREMTYLATVTEGNTYFDGKVASGNYYRYAVTAVFDAGESDMGAGVYIKRLANPYAIKAVNKTDGINVTWGKINGAGSYRVYRRAAGEKYWTYICTSSTTSYLDKNVKGGTYYKYTIRAVSGNTFSSYNDGALVRRLENPEVNNFTFTNNSIKFTWDKVSGATGYRVYRRGAGQGWRYLCTTSATSYTDKNVTKNAYYRYTLKAVCGGYMSDFNGDTLFVKFTGAIDKPDTKSEIVSYYNNSINKAKSSAKNVVLVRGGSENFNCFVDLGDDTANAAVESEMINAAKMQEYNQSIKRSYLPPMDNKCNITASNVKSATCREEKYYYYVTLVLYDQKNPKVGNGGVGSAIDVATEDIYEDAYEDSGIEIRDFSVEYANTTVVAKINKLNGRIEYLTTSSNTSLNIKMYAGEYMNMSATGKDVMEYRISF